MLGPMFGIPDLRSSAHVEPLFCLNVAATTSNPLYKSDRISICGQGVIARLCTCAHGDAMKLTARAAPHSGFRVNLGSGF